MANLYDTLVKGIFGDTVMGKTLRSDGVGDAFKVYLAHEMFMEFSEPNTRIMLECIECNEDIIIKRSPGAVRAFLTHRDHTGARFYVDSPGKKRRAGGNNG